MAMNIELLEGLNALFESSFPKKCACCGRIFETSEQFLFETQEVPYGKSSLKEVIEDDGAAIVEVFRNCPCGSTLMDEFQNRRDDTEKGLIRRQNFAKLMDYLMAQGVPKETARQELLKFLHGEASEIVAELLKTLNSNTSS
jgi:hypothetical protein